MMRKFSSKASRLAASICIVLVGQRAVHAVRLLRHDVDPAALVAAREARAGAPARHVIEHGDVLGDAERIVGGQHDAELADADALGLHGEVEIEQHRVVGELEAFDVEVMLGEADRVVAELVGRAGLLGELLQHALIEIAAHARHAGFDLGAAADGGQVEQRSFHLTSPAASPRRQAPGCGSRARGCRRS